MMRCPSCRSPFPRPPAGEGKGACEGCGAPIVVDDVAIDVLARPIASRSWGERAMGSAWLSRIYDRVWRPAAFSVSTGFGAPRRRDEGLAVLALLGDRAGPWLDLSCGSGWLTRRMVEKARHEGAAGEGGGPRDVFGVDRSRSMLERARTEAPRAVLVRADAASLPFADGVFAAVANLAALDLYPEPENVVREAARVLASGGRWVCSSFVRGRARGQVPRRGAFSGVRTPTLDELADWARRAGLTRFGKRLFRGYVIAWADKA
jgi:SAM-dependent methyltransferase